MSRWFPFSEQILQTFSLVSGCAHKLDDKRESVPDPATTQNYCGIRRPVFFVRGAHESSSYMDFGLCPPCCSPQGANGNPALSKSEVAYRRPRVRSAFAYDAGRKSGAD